MIADDLNLIEKTLVEIRSSLPILRTLPLSFRKIQLESLIKGLKEMETVFASALSQDLAYSPFASFVFSHNITLTELRHTLQHFPEWAKERSVPTPVVIGPASSWILPEPLGLVLVSFLFLYLHIFLYC
jgi:aldehyde dehydrogenase (NAD+)